MTQTGFPWTFNPRVLGSSPSGLTAEKRNVADSESQSVNAQAILADMRGLLPRRSCQTPMD